MLAFPDEYYGMIFRATQSVELFCAYNQSAISLIIRATSICWNQVVCKGMAGNKGILLRINVLVKAVHLLKYILNKEYRP